MRPERKKKPQAVVAVDGHDGSWNARGRTRTLRLADGNSLREELTDYRRPDGVRYVIDGTPLSAPFVAFVIGVFWRRYMVRALATGLAGISIPTKGDGSA